MGPGDVRLAEARRAAACASSSGFRWELRTPRIVERVVEVTRSPELAGHSHLAVDATGVGRPVLDMLRDCPPGCILMPVIVTGGERETHEAGYYRVPKRDLIIGLQVLLQREALQIAAGLTHGPGPCRRDGRNAGEDHSRGPRAVWRLAGGNP